MSSPLASRQSAEDSLCAYAGRRVAVTGASGFIGRSLARALGAADCELVPVGRDWSAAVEADVVFHLAAQTSLDLAAADPAADFEANVTPMRELLASCRRSRRMPFLVFAGTATQAGVTMELPVSEDVPDHPVSEYDRHKLQAEQALETAVRSGLARGTTLRLSNVYGPGAGAGAGRPDRDVLNRMIRAALRGEHLTIYGSGEYVRDYLYIDDAIAAFVAAPLHHHALNGRHFVVGSGRGFTIRDAVAEIAARVGARTGVAVRVLHDRERRLSPLEQRHFIADASRFAAITGWSALWDLRDGIDRTIEAFACE